MRNWLPAHRRFVGDGGYAGLAGEPRPSADFQEVDVDSLQMSNPAVGVEHVGLHAASALGLIETLNDLGEPQA